MPGYRLYYVRDGHIVAADWCMAEGDDEALAWAETARDGKPVELWSGKRVVACLPACLPACLTA